jgi:hypothetical protein
MALDVIRDRLADVLGDGTTGPRCQRLELLVYHLFDVDKNGPHES